ncbi:unnamed protein product (macronuclear) [Paramecium tetraurelia]|uniref:Uncharacterized protein n=1 Tax=Paramecium tetraurelia TaxID=5888 RepID=A0CZR9_PARTE|nr:uncharacterized protein GSPATT00011859001 [Paramecium tetraurelia]CAK76286.1 unnamed protein product [Paramecium tetraurelia]|eukprot:XP_001443683.1 hypothetical protein (macronuclear) [Paramecium tetraurelia strain d4-2]
MNSEGFVSLMMEKDDSYQFQPTENKFKINNDDDFYRQLSQEFYGQQNSSYFKKNKKLIKTIDTHKFKSKPPFQTSESQKSQYSFTNQQQSQQIIQQKIYKLFTKQTPFQQTLSKQLDRSIYKARNLYDNTPQFTFKLNVSNSSKNLLKQQSPQLSQRSKLNEEDYQGFQQQRSHRNTLNSCDKSIKKQDKTSDIYYPLKLNPYKAKEIGNLFQLSFRSKQ